MEHVNHTPFPAVAFDGAGVGGAAFHVFVLRQTLSFASGTLEYADTQEPLLCTDDDNAESDFCPFKPKCDVLLNVTAHAPGSRPVDAFNVRLRVTSPAAAAVLIDKTLTVTGERTYVRKGWLARLLGRLVRKPHWRLTAPAPFTQLPLSPALAFGGECKLRADDPAASRVPKEYVLDPPQEGMIAWDAFEPNLVGRGYLPDWYQHAARPARWPAPRIEYASAPTSPDPRSGIPAHFSIRAKTHPERRALAGTLNDAFTCSGKPLPDDFDLAFWNAAPPDQQVDTLPDDACLELTNLCAPETPGACVDADGATTLRLQRPPHECFILLRMQDGELIPEPMVPDTVTIDPEARRLSIVWRLVISSEEAVRAAEFRMWPIAERGKLQIEIPAELLDDASLTPG